jgi:hypothetical protein
METKIPSLGSGFNAFNGDVKKIDKQVIQFASRILAAGSC